MSEKALVVVPWHDEKQITAFRRAWSVGADDERIVFQRDKNKQGCAVTKNNGIEAARDRAADIVIVLDDDCFPSDETLTLDDLIQGHVACLSATTGSRFLAVTEPPSRGTPYLAREPESRVAASMGYWCEVGDYDACGQLVHGAMKPMRFHRRIESHRYFPLCGMNLAFRPDEWGPWWQFIDVARFDDIWMGWLWQKEAYRRGYSFNLGGPIVRHSRQSNVWQNLRDEAVHLERNETLWRDIADSNETEYAKLRALLPV